MKIAVYAGTFDPITNGHLDIALRAAGLFNKLYIAVAQETNKHTLFTLEERAAMIQGEVKDKKNIEVVMFDGLLVNFAHKIGANTIVRGLRAVSDFDIELQMALMNKEMANDIETVFLPASPQYLFISSSIIKNVASLGGDISGLVPENVNLALRDKFQLNLK